MITEVRMMLLIGLIAIGTSPFCFLGVVKIQDGNILIGSLLFVAGCATTLILYYLFELIISTTLRYLRFIHSLPQRVVQKMLFWRT